MRRRSFTIGFMIIFIPIFLFFWCTVFFLWRSGEAWPVDAIVNDQIENDSIYSPLVIIKEDAYKIELLKRIKPKVIALGSSRVLQVKQDFFNDKFVNMGRAFDFYNSEQDVRMMDEAYKKEKLVLWGLDYWILSETYYNHKINQNTTLSQLKFKINGEKKLSIAHPSLFEIWKYGIFNFGLKSIWDFVLLGQVNKTPKMLGLKAALWNDGGYERDGSYLYFNLHVDEMDTLKKLKKDLAEIRKDNTVYGIVKNEKISNIAIEKFARALTYLKSKNNVVVFLPPLPQIHAKNLIVSEEYRDFYHDLINRVTKICTTLEIPFYNYLDYRLVEFGDRFFYDTIHPTQIAMAKIIHLISLKQKLIVTKDLINISELSGLGSVPDIKF